MAAFAADGGNVWVYNIILKYSGFWIYHWKVKWVIWPKT